jgi:RhtB (resistance to homoserine/threonine) family protein
LEGKRRGRILELMQLSWAGYSTFIVFVLLLTIAPGPDFAVVMKNALAGGRAAGLWTTVGINISNAVQGTLAALGLGAVIVASRPLFETIRWAGIAYLCWLGLQTLRWTRQGPQAGTPGAEPLPSGGRRRRLLQGVLSNITNPKVLVFYLSVLPQFLPAHPSLLDALVLANTLPVIGFCWLVLVVSGVHTVRRWLTRRRVRRTLDVLTAAALVGFAGKLAADAS